MKDLPAARVGWTAMTLSLINIDLEKAMQKLAAVAASSLSSSPPDEEARSRVIDEATARIDERLDHCNPIIPRHRLTLVCSRFLLRKIDFVTRTEWDSLQRSGKSKEVATDANLVEALEILECRLSSDDELLKQFAWVRKAYPQ
jgi:hypothetical protein